VVEFSPATREARVRFPADAFLLLPFSNNDWGSWIKQTIVRSPRMVRWCSGYHICLTRRRSPVRSRPESSNIFVQNGVQKVIRIWWLVIPSLQFHYASSLAFYHRPAIAQLVERRTVDEMQLSLGRWFKSASRDHIFCSIDWINQKKQSLFTVVDI
jgi:hypothetical protein